MRNLSALYIWIFSAAYLGVFWVLANKYGHADAPLWIWVAVSLGAVFGLLIFIGAMRSALLFIAVDNVGVTVTHVFPWRVKREHIEKHRVTRSELKEGLPDRHGDQWCLALVKVQNREDLELGSSTDRMECVRLCEQFDRALFGDERRV